MHFLFTPGVTTHISIINSGSFNTQRLHFADFPELLPKTRLSGPSPNSLKCLESLTNKNH
jgi:hypothetical protein